MYMSSSPKVSSHADPSSSKIDAIFEASDDNTASSSNVRFHPFLLLHIKRGVYFNNSYGTFIPCFEIRH